MMQYKLDASIEFAHSYTAETVGRSQLLSAEIFQNKAQQFEAQGKLYTSVVLIDDINGQPAEDRQKIAEELRRTFGRIDRCVFESELLSACKILLRSLDKKNLIFQSFSKTSKKVLFLKMPDCQIALAEFKDKKFQPTCACFVAAWHLIRLGAINYPGFMPAEHSISILEEKYRQVELKAKRIIHQSVYQDYADRILHQFYEI